MIAPAALALYFNKVILAPAALVLPILVTPISKIRDYWSMTTPERIVPYMCEIQYSGNAPLFAITDLDSGKQVAAKTATDAWAQVIAVASSLKGNENLKSISGPDYFGLTNPTVAY